MCGIGGIMELHAGNGEGLRNRLDVMRTAMDHRGPDDAGTFVREGAGVGVVACRLAIRDLSAAGHMPMRNDADDVVISYNGEIYNADELRSELRSSGARFRSTSDTEVILRGYEAWGRGVVSRLRGMFAFAIMDLRRGSLKLLLARDRLGIKPLYYAMTSGGIVFASELQALVRSAVVDPEIDPHSVISFLQLGSVPSPRTIYSGIRCLPPASTLEVTGDGAQETRYWCFPDARVRRDRREAAEVVRSLLDDAVRRHLVSDVPLGVFLSGGLDSAVVAALAKATGVERLATCSIAFPGTPFDESSAARQMAASLDADHQEERITPLDMADDIHAIVGAMDQPTIDGVNTYFVSRAARRAGLTVAMSGLGGDELFLGYPDTFGRIPRLLRGLRLGSTPWVAPAARFTASFLGVGRAKLTDALTREPTAASAYLACRGLFSPTEVSRLVGVDRNGTDVSGADVLALIEEAAGSPGEGSDLSTWISRAELGMYTRNQLLRDTDVMSMHHSLEVRVPLLDDRLVEGVLEMRSQPKRGNGAKPLLVAACGDLLPRREGGWPKKGFTFPFDTWLRHELRDLVADALDPAAFVDGWLDPAEVQDVRRRFDQGQVHWSRPWALVVLRLWLEGARVRSSA